MREGMAADHTTPDANTRAAEKDEARAVHKADRDPTAEEAQRAEQLQTGADVRQHEQEMAKRGAGQQGEGRIP